MVFSFFGGNQLSLKKTSQSTSEPTKPNRIRKRNGRKGGKAKISGNKAVYI